ncbi:MAG: Rpn family recombination-promoting nuclease/putative transposase [Saprospiraceae bacterium]|nr:Rpn family recombination-promoting nuclease/putative transposase [Saprospiraceae bacterium]MDW8229091.1 Rpn family recombination-promoting nuclease/putative transposase [Saprospiraceae bacterium]
MARKRKERIAIPLLKAHDLFFQICADDLILAQGLVQYTTPEEIHSQIVLEELRRAPTVHVSSDLKIVLGDVVYETRLRRSDCESKVLILFEHKSAMPSQPIYTQLLSYMLPVWQQDERDGGPLTPVVVVVFYHGKRPWKKKDYYRFFKCLPPGWEDLIPHFRFILFDLNQVSAEEILSHKNIGFLGVSLLTFKFAHQWERLAEYIPQMMELILEWPANEREKRLLKSWLIYLQSILDMNKIKASEFISRVPRNGQEAYELFMELFAPRAAEIIGEWKAERIAAKKVEETLERVEREAKQRGHEQGLAEGREEGRAEGREEGRAEGREEAKREIVIHLLQVTPEWNDAKIATVVGVSEELVRQLRYELTHNPNDEDLDGMS